MVDFGPAKAKKKSDITKDRDKLPPKIIKMSAIPKLIEKREKAFIEAIIQILEKCEKKNLDPAQELDKGKSNYLPDPPLSPTENRQPTSHVTERPLISALLEQIKDAPFYEDQLVPDGRRTWPERNPRFGELNASISPAIWKALSSTRNITTLYCHQAEAINALCEGEDVIVTTSTASGKSLIYQIPVLDSLLKDGSSKAMYIFPTKALAQDQLRSLQDIISACEGIEDVKTSTFDGDTPSEQRRYIRETANIIFTNPDMLHHSILPNHHQWRHFLETLKFVVVDELHVYNGLFGSNVALIMRRLRRLCHMVGNYDVRFASCSATIGNAAQHMRAIFGLHHVHLVNEDGAPCGRKEFVLWNPPVVNKFEPKLGRKSSIQEAAFVLEYLISRDIRTIVFCKVRKTCELLMKQIRSNLQANLKQDMLKRVMSYRGGYTPQDRRRIERQMFSGELLAVIATNALELGVDIGSLDAVMMLGVPWSISAMWQQSGRAGRRNNDSLSLLVAAENPMDQFYMHHPHKLYSQPMSDIAIDIENPITLEGHLQCAALEKPIDLSKDLVYFGQTAESVCMEHLKRDPSDPLYRCHPRFLPTPSKFVSIRSTTEETYTVVDVTNGKHIIIEEVEANRVPFELYEGAIFIHQGVSYLVDECNVDQCYARVRRVNVDWITRQRDFTDVDANDVERSRIMTEGQRLFYGKLKVSTHVYGYYKVDKRNHILDAVDVYMDPIVRNSNGLWIDVPISALKEMAELDINVAASIHAAGHSLVSMMPTFAFSPVGDVRTECKSPLAKRQRPARISLYEPEACGTTGRAYPVFERLLHAAYETIITCQCEEGCPQCVHYPQCSEQNLLCNKQGAIIILREILAKRI
ncbi:ATP-dependent 3'-5' DNA helicase [Umbelopsis sp. WA50703]